MDIGGEDVQMLVPAVHFHLVTTMATVMEQMVTALVTQDGEVILIVGHAHVVGLVLIAR